MRRIGIIINLLIIAITCYSQAVIINEFQPSNSTTITDRDGEYSDWFELYNPNDSTVNLEGWFVTDDPSVPEKWKFPSVLIPSEEYLIIFASDKDTVFPDGEVHTNFKIGNGDEGVYLYHPDTTLADTTPVVNVTTDWSYGRYPDATANWFYFDLPTPGEGNSSSPIGNFAQPPVFSHAAGYYASSFLLEITPANPGDTVYYTLDGSIPTQQSAVYSGPVLMVNKANIPNRLSTIQTTLPGQGFASWKLPNGNVYKFNTVRARVFKSGYYPSPTTSGSYIIDPLLSTRYNYPLVSIMSDSINFFCDTIGIYKAGVGIDSSNWLTAHFAQEGIAWERDIHVEIFDQAGVPVISQDAGVRISGNYTRTTNIKSLRLYARSEYGNSTFNYQFFNNIPITEFKRIRLRNTGNDAQNAYMRDALINEVIRPFFPAISSWRPSVVFLDGEFWGIHNMRESQDKYFFESRFGIENENLDFLEMNSLIIEGTNVHYNAMLNFVSNSNMADSSNYTYLCTQLDPVNYAAYLVNSIYTGQTDWPVHNVRFWRNRTSSYLPNNPYGQDGRWRWLLVDQDFGLGRTSSMAANYDHLDRVLNLLSGWQNKLIVRLLGNSTNSGNLQFRHLFINTMADWMNTVYKPERMMTVYQMFVDTLMPRMPEHINRWRYPATMSHWQTVYCPTVTNYITQRPAFMKQFLISNFSLPGSFNLSVDINDSIMGRVRVNSLIIDSLTPGLTNSAHPYPWSGTYYRGVPVQVSARPNPGYAFSHWEGYSNSSDSLLIISPVDTLVSLTAHFIPQYIPEPDLVHFWLFDNNIINDTPLDTINAVYSLTGGALLRFHSALNGYPFDPLHPNWRKASMERRNAPTPINYRPEGNNDLPYGSFTMRAIQIKQPFTGDGGENTMYFEAPTTGYEDIKFTFAAKNELAADGMIVEYSVTDPPVWTTAGLTNSTLPLTSDFQLFTVDFANIPAADENPDFQVRLRFYGSNMSADLGNRVTFNNVAIDGVSTYVPSDFYSKTTGDLNVLSTWGANPDGSGTAPLNFSNESTVYHLQNRTETTLTYPWSVSGTGSKVVVGDGYFPSTLIIEDILTATVDVSEGSKLHLKGATYPVLGSLEPGSIVKFSDEAQSIPYGTYHSLIFSGIAPVFTGTGTVTIQGNMTLEGAVPMPDARGANLYSLLFSGDSIQLINTGANVLRSYNLTFIKSAGAIGFTPESRISCDNQFASTIGPAASFADNGITIYAGNSVNIGGTGASYNFTGKLILAGTEAGIVKGAGAANNFNVRDADATNKNAVAALNNLIIRVANTGGEFRLRDGTLNTFTIKGDLIVESTAAGRIRFYNNDVLIGGDLIIQEGFSGTLDAVKSVNFNGSEVQNVSTSIPVNLTSLFISNSAEMVTADAIFDVATLLNFNSGILKTSVDGLIKIGLTGQITGTSSTKYVEGNLGRRSNSITPIILDYPMGVDDQYLPFTFEVSHTGVTENLYIGSITLTDVAKMPLSEEIEYLSGNQRYSLITSGANTILSGKITLPFDPEALGFDPQWLRVAASSPGGWLNLGGQLAGNTVASVENITQTATYALAKAVEPHIVPDTLTLQNMTIGEFADTCFAAVERITVGGDGTTFEVTENGNVNLVAGQRVYLYPHTTVASGGYLHAWIDETGNYCNQPAALPSVSSEPVAEVESQTMSVMGNRFDFNLFPNPTNGLFTLELRNSTSVNVSQIEVYSLLGERIFSLKSADNKRFAFDLTSYPAGVYLVRVISGNSAGFAKVVKR